MTEAVFLSGWKERMPEDIYDVKIQNVNFTRMWGGVRAGYLITCSFLIP